MLKRLTCLAFGLALIAAPAVAQDMSLEEIIQNHIEAVGGRDTLDNVKTIRLNGKMSMAAQGFEAPFTLTQKRPGMVRLQVVFQGMTMVQAYDGESGWQIMPFQGKTDPEKMSEDDAENIADMGDIDGVLIDSEKKGHKVELEGKEDLEGAEAFKLKVTKKNGDVEYHFLDAEYYLPLKIETKTEVQGTEIEIEMILGDYKEVEGLMMAHSFEQRPKGAPAGQMFVIESVEVNPEIENSEFVMPEPAPAEEEEAAAGE
jgi:outer membrane lipoprotein-sorting protein